MRVTLCSSYSSIYNNRKFFHRSSSVRNTNVLIRVRIYCYGVFFKRILLRITWLQDFIGKLKITAWTIIWVLTRYTENVANIIWSNTCKTRIIYDWSPRNFRSVWKFFTKCSYFKCSIIGANVETADNPIDIIWKTKLMIHLWLRCFFEQNHIANRVKLLGHMDFQ